MDFSDKQKDTVEEAKEVDVPAEVFNMVYATSEDEKLLEKFTDDKGAALKEAKKKMIQDLNDPRAQTKLMEDMQRAIDELKAAHR